ncbi:MAG: hypothetical protein CM15mP59_4700 [Flavobacteriaceae bacterium]|nr:MAG: hypothetical protein CM15mP59_4700 [Flavobacteriaceae bacterium]
MPKHWELPQEIEYHHFLFEDRLPIRRSFVVSGLYDSGFPDFDQRIAFADLRHIQKIYQWESHLVGALEMTLTDFDDIETLSESVYDQVPAHTTCRTSRSATLRFLIGSHFSTPISP